MAGIHAKNYPPSSATRYLSCPGSVTVAPLYPEDPSVASDRGDMAHLALAAGLLFEVEPNTPDVDVNESVGLALDWVRERRFEYGADCNLHVEQRLDIPITGEFGTADLVLEAPQILEVADFKNGYVPVDVFMNAQMLSYLIGAIAKYGERKRYRITVIQPNYNHRDGPIRTYDVSNDDIRWFEDELTRAVASKEFYAGKHCKKTYCPHRGTCQTFQAWAIDNAGAAWFPSEVNALSDEQLAESLDYADILHGIRDELRKEAMRRQINMDRRIPGWKLVRSKMAIREFKSDGVISQVADVARAMGATDEDLYDRKFVSVKGIEDFAKKYAQLNKLGRGAWKTLWNNQFAPFVRESVPGLTLEREIDGRPAHRRGGEFGAILPPAGLDTNVLTALNAPSVPTVI
jgi:hypothetical protein